MLEDTRKRGATIAIYVIFGILIAVFVINFGPQGPGGQQGCSFSSKLPTKLTLDGKNYGMSTWQWAENTQPASASRFAAARKVRAMDDLVKRELLAQEAEARGLRITDDVLDDRIKRGEIYVLTTPLAERPDLGGEKAYFEEGIYFNYKYLERWIGNFGLTIGTFKSELRRELLAQAMIDELRAGAHVTRDEAFSLWLHANTDVTMDVVSFPVERYQAKIVLTPDDIARFAKDHEAEIKAKYEADKLLTYTATPAKVHLWRVFVARTPDATPAPGTGAGSGTGTGTGTGSAAPADPKPDPARAKLAKARGYIIAKTKTFQDIAKDLDTDEAIKEKSGDLGWVSVDAPGIGNKDVSEAVKALAVGGEPSEIIDTPEGFWLLWASEKREGDLTYDQVKGDIAAQLAAEHWSREAARKDALAALNEARAGKGKNLNEMFEAAAPPPRPGSQDQGVEDLVRQIEEEINDPTKSEEEKEQLRKILQGIKDGTIGGGPGPTGALRYDSPIVPVKWEQDGEPAGGGAAAPVAAEPPAPAAADINAPVTEALPKFVGVDKATVQRIGPMPRDREEIIDLGKSKALITDVFDNLEEGALAGKIYEVELLQSGIRSGTAFVVVQVIAKGKPDVTQFDQQADSLIEGERESRADEIVATWLEARCKKLADGGKIKAAQDAMLVMEDGEQKVVPYTPCGSLD